MVDNVLTVLNVFEGRYNVKGVEFYCSPCKKREKASMFD